MFCKGIDSGLPRILERAFHLPVPGWMFMASRWREPLVPGLTASCIAGTTRPPEGPLPSAYLFAATDAEPGCGEPPTTKVHVPLRIIRLMVPTAARQELLRPLWRPGWANCFLHPHPPISRKATRPGAPALSSRPRPRWQPKRCSDLRPGCQAGYLAKCSTKTGTGPNVRCSRRRRVGPGRMLTRILLSRRGLTLRSRRPLPSM